MQAHILSLHTPSAPGIGSKGQNFFLNVVMLPIKLKFSVIIHYEWAALFYFKWLLKFHVKTKGEHQSWTNYR